MERWSNKVAVVTGASSGIGAAIVKDFILAGLQVVGLARRKEKIEALRDDLPVDKRSQLTALCCDVSNLKCVNEVFDEIIARFGGIDVLVNNAGCGKPGKLANMDVGDIQQVLQTNVMGVIHCTQRAFKSMTERNFNGHIILINSIGGHQVLPTSSCTNIYSPTKYALTAINEIYRQEFNEFGTKIKVTVCLNLICIRSKTTYCSFCRA